MIKREGYHFFNTTISVILQTTSVHWRST